MAADRLALYTTIYPGVERYLAAWYGSVQAQTDPGFDLWVGLDKVTPGEVCAAIGAEPEATWVPSEPGATPADVRQNALARIAEKYAAIVLVDSDDLLYPTRVERARKGVREYDVAGCALSIMDEAGQDLGIVFTPPPGTCMDAILPRYNIFGMSNTAYRAAVFKQALPIPSDCVLIDWLLATRAWANGASLYFDPTPGMAYRQYGANVARVLSPFTEQQVLEATGRVLRHYSLVLSGRQAIPRDKLAPLSEAQHRVQIFQNSITESAPTLREYVRALNSMSPQYVWWWCVAHPDLEAIWTS